MTTLAELKPQPMDPAHRDAERYQTAQSIQQANPGWLVIWGVYTRQYVAFPLFRAPTGYIVASGNPDTLVQRMRQAELAFTPGQARAHSQLGLRKRSTTMTPQAGRDRTSRIQYPATGPLHSRDRSRAAGHGPKSRRQMPTASP